jgi:hypothetical protein
LNIGPIEQVLALPLPTDPPGPRPGPEDKMPPADMPPDDMPEESMAAPPPVSAEVLAVFRALLVSDAGRLLHKECNAIRRASKKPGEFLKFLDEFYHELQHEAFLRVSLLPQARCLLSLRGQAGDAEQAAAKFAGQHCAASRGALLDLAGVCKPAELEAGVNETCQLWEVNRPVQMADNLMEAAGD